jgi:MFS family permease
MAWFVQPWFIRAELPVTMFGVLWTLLNLSVGISALFAYKFERLFGARTTVIAITISLALGFMGAAILENYWGLLFLLIFYLARGIATPVLKDYINRITTSDIRATILSVRNFVIRIIFALWGPFYGWYTDAFGLGGAIIIAGLVFIVLAGTSYIFFVKYNFPKLEHNKL